MLKNSNYENNQNKKSLKVGIDFSKFFMSLFNTHLNLEDIANSFSDDIDNIILNFKEKQLHYIGGIFSVQLEGKDTFLVKYDLYFQDANKELLNKTASSNPMDLEYLTDSAISELRKKKKVEFEINEPSIK
mgnify:FL=1